MKYIMYSSSVMLNYSKVVGKVFFKYVFLCCVYFCQLRFYNLFFFRRGVFFQKRSVQEQNINFGLVKIYVLFYVFKDMKLFVIIFKKYMICDSLFKDRQRLCYIFGFFVFNLQFVNVFFNRGFFKFFLFFFGSFWFIKNYLDQYLYWIIKINFFCEVKSINYWYI